MDRVLIADDQADVLESLHILLKNEGFAMDAVNSPRGVIEAVSSRHYDVLLLDMNYARDTTSGGEGLELLSRVRQLDDTLPVLLMTAWGTVGLAVEAMRTGACDFVEKPWDNDKLVSAVRRSIEVGRARQQQSRMARASTEVLNDLEEARATQRQLLPGEMPEVQGIQIQSAWIPALNVGGDYFDAIRLNDHMLGFCIADVSGKGLPAALLMSNVQAMVRAYATIERPPADMCCQLNRTVSANTQDGRFITMFYGVLDTRTNALRYTNAGHVPPIVLRGDGSQTTLQEGGLGLGMFPDSRYEQGTVFLNPGDHLILMTDGITEAENMSGRQFGEDDGVAQCLARKERWTASGLKAALLDAVTAFAGNNLQDDATLLVVSRV